MDDPTMEKHYNSHPLGGMMDAHLDNLLSDIICEQSDVIKAFEIFHRQQDLNIKTAIFGRTQPHKPSKRVEARQHITSLRGTFEQAVYNGFSLTENNILMPIDTPLRVASIQDPDMGNLHVIVGTRTGKPLAAVPAGGIFSGRRRRTEAESAKDAFTLAYLFGQAHYFQKLKNNLINQTPADNLRDDLLESMSRAAGGHFEALSRQEPPTIARTLFPYPET